MNQTDRQTDKSRGSWWIITAYGDDIEKCKQNTAWPQWVKEIGGGVEECPTTKRMHYQGAVNTQQVRFSQLKSWLTQSHIELADDPVKAKAYCMKKDTAVGEKKVLKATKNYYPMEQLLTFLGYVRLNEQEKIAEVIEDAARREVKNPDKEVYWFCVKKVLEVKGSYLIASYARADLFTAWDNLQDYWMMEALSITGLQTEELQNEIISPA